MTLLKDQISLMKEEIRHKNYIIDTLINELNHSSYCDKKQSTYNTIVDNGDRDNCANNISSVEDNNAAITRNFMQRCSINNGMILF